MEIDKACDVVVSRPLISSIPRFHTIPLLSTLYLRLSSAALAMRWLRQGLLRVDLVPACVSGCAIPCPIHLALRNKECSLRMSSHPSRHSTVSVETEPLDAGPSVAPISNYPSSHSPNSPPPPRQLVSDHEQQAGHLRRHRRCTPLYHRLSATSTGGYSTSCVTTISWIPERILNIHGGCSRHLYFPGLHPVRIPAVTRPPQRP